MAPTAREIFVKNLASYMRSRGVEQADIVQHLGLSASTVSDWVNGKKYPRVDAMQRLADMLGVAMSDLTAEVGDVSAIPDFPNIRPIRKKRVPLLGKIAGGVPIYADEDLECFALADEDLHCDFALEVEGDSMVDARINNGDIVFIREQPDVENGEIAAVIIDDSATLKRVYKTKAGLQLVSANPKYAPMVFNQDNSEYIRILGKAVAVQSRL